MSHIPTPPSSRETSIEPSDEKCEAALDDKIQHLDKLLERYLHLLDTHQKLQVSLGKQFSSGFFQLAHANYVSPGRRFGEDFYDERMKATRRLNITSLPANTEQESSCIDTRLEKVQFEVKYKSVLVPEDDNEEANDEERDSEQAGPETAANNTQHSNPDNKEETEQQQINSASGIATPPAQTQVISNNGSKDEDANTTAIRTEQVEASAKKKKKIFRSDDPISWYGILVPSSLKSAQKSFVEAIDGEIPELVTVLSEMRCVEDMVYELRREIENQN